MQTITLQATPSQQTKVVLDGQNCQILVYQKPNGIFVDLNIDGVDIVTSIIARDATKLVCREYAGFSGNLMFVDTQGSADPSFDGLADRFALVYLNAAENDLVYQ